MSSTGSLVQILLPIYDNDGRRLPEGVYAETRAELTERFGGLTAYQRAPARGLWKTDEGDVALDDIVIFEVMATALDRDWWHAARERWQRRFRQDVLVIRAMAVELL